MPVCNIFFFGRPQFATKAAENRRICARYFSQTARFFGAINQLYCRARADARARVKYVLLVAGVDVSPIVLLRITLVNYWENSEQQETGQFALDAS